MSEVPLYTLTLHDVPLESPMAVPDVEDFSSHLEDALGLSSKISMKALPNGLVLQEFEVSGLKSFELMSNQKVGNTF